MKEEAGRTQQALTVDDLAFLAHCQAVRRTAKEPASARSARVSGAVMVALGLLIFAAVTWTYVNGDATALETFTNVWILLALTVGTLVCGLGLASIFYLAPTMDRESFTTGLDGLSPAQRRRFRQLQRADPIVNVVPLYWPPSPTDQMLAGPGSSEWDRAVRRLTATALDALEDDLPSAQDAAEHLVNMQAYDAERKAGTHGEEVAEIAAKYDTNHPDADIAALVEQHQRRTAEDKQQRQDLLEQARQHVRHLAVERDALKAAKLRHELPGA